MASKTAIELLRNGLKDISRPDEFEVEITRANPVGDRANNTVLNLTHDLIRSIQIPATVLGEITISRMGRQLKLPGNLNSGEVNATFLHDSEGKVKDFFHAWQKDYYGEINGGSFNQAKNFSKSTVTIFQLDGKHEKISKTILNHVWPKTIGEMELNHDSGDQLMQFSIIFAYNYALYSYKPPNFTDIIQAS